MNRNVFKKVFYGFVILVSGFALRLLVFAVFQKLLGLHASSFGGVFALSYLLVTVGLIYAFRSSFPAAWVSILFAAGVLIPMSVIFLFDAEVSFYALHLVEIIGGVGVGYLLSRRKKVIENIPAM